MSIDPTRFYAQQQQQRGDQFRTLMSMLLMMQRMKGQRQQQQWQRGMEEKQLGMYSQTQQAIQAQQAMTQKARQAQYDQATFALEQSRQQQAKVQELLAEADPTQRKYLEWAIYAGKDPRVINLEYKTAEQALANAKQLYKKRGIEIENLEAWGNVTPELALQVATTSLQPLQGVAGQLMQTYQQMRSYKEGSKEYEALRTRFLIDYQLALKTYPMIGQNEGSWFWRYFNEATPIDMSGLYGHLEGPSYLQRLYETLETPKTLGDKIKKKNLLQKIKGIGKAYTEGAKGSVLGPKAPGWLGEKQPETEKEIHPSDITDDLMRSKGMDEYQLLEDLRKLIDPSFNTPELIRKNEEDFEKQFGLRLRQVVGYLEFRTGIPPQARQ